MHDHHEYRGEDKKGGEKQRKKSAGNEGMKKKTGEKGEKNLSSSSKCECQAHIVGVPLLDTPDTGNGNRLQYAAPVFYICSQYYDYGKTIGTIKTNVFTVGNISGDIDKVTFTDGAIVFFGKKPVTLAFAGQTASLDDRSLRGLDLISNHRLDITGGTKGYDSGFIQPLRGESSKNVQLLFVYACKNGYDECNLPEGADTFFQSPLDGKNFCIPDIFSPLN